MTRIAAIDVGTNAMRCLVVKVGQDHEPRVLENVRAPVRLGSHVFLTGQIGRSAGDRTIDAFRGFRGMIDRHQVQHVRAVATSAFREASDAAVLRDRICEETGVEIRVISGAEEAHLVRRAIGSGLGGDKDELGGKSGHFYFGENRTSVLWADMPRTELENPISRGRTVSHFHQKKPWPGAAWLPSAAHQETIKIASNGRRFRPLPHGRRLRQSDERSAIGEKAASGCVPPARLTGRGHACVQ